MGVGLTSGRFFKCTRISDHRTDIIALTVEWDGETYPLTVRCYDSFNKRRHLDIIRRYGGVVVADRLQPWVVRTKHSRSSSEGFLRIHEREAIAPFIPEAPCALVGHMVSEMCTDQIVEWWRSLVGDSHYQYNAVFQGDEISEAQAFAAKVNLTYG